MVSVGNGRLVARATLVAVAAISSLILAATVYADSGAPSSIHLDSQAGTTITVSGTWTWPEMATASKVSYTGFAIDWGDVTSGNRVGTYHIGDGTAATNIVKQPTTPAQGSSGQWGPASHTYAASGEYTVCVIIYDLGQVKPFKTTGYHSLQAGGTGHNSDNSVDETMDPPVSCLKVEVTVPTATPTRAPSNSPSVSPSASVSVDPSATPFESFQGDTAVPSLPSTGTAEDTAPGGGNGTLPWILLVTAGLIAALAASRVKAYR